MKSSNRYDLKTGRILSAGGMPAKWVQKRNASRTLKEVWTDMRPLSLRKNMAEAASKTD